MVKIVKILIVAGFLLFFADIKEAIAHPFYVSICQIDYNQQNHVLEISVKIFADDLIKALKQNEISDIHLGELQENPKSDQYIFNYLSENLIITIKNESLTYSFIGKELEDDAVWCYLEIKNVPAFHEISVLNSILTEVFETQNNIVQVNVNGKVKNLLLKKSNTVGHLNFN